MIGMIVLACTGIARAADIQYFRFDRIIANPHDALMRAPVMEVAYLFAHEKKDHFISFTCGATVPFITIVTDTFFKIEMGGAGCVWSRFEMGTESFNLMHTDYLGLAYFAIKYKAVSLETSVFHRDAHVGDDYAHYRFRQRKNVQWNSVREYLDIEGFDMVHVSLGIEYKFFREPVKKVYNYFSVYYGWRFDFRRFRVPLYLEWEAEVTDFRHIPNVGLKLGLYLDYLFSAIILNNAEYRKNKAEIFFHYYYGSSPAGYFYTKRESLLRVGTGYRL